MSRFSVHTKGTVKKYAKMLHTAKISLMKYENQVFNFFFMKHLCVFFDIPFFRVQE